MTVTRPEVLEIDGTAVALVPWPAESGRRRALAATGVPRLLLVGPDAGPPVVDDLLEDWVYLPRDADDIARRARRLARLAGGTP